MDHSSYYVYYCCLKHTGISILNHTLMHQVFHDIPMDLTVSMFLAQYFTLLGNESLASGLCESLPNCGVELLTRSVTKIWSRLGD